MSNSARLIWIVLVTLFCGGAVNAQIPVILDTDIGDDIDDTWALVMLLKSPQFDVKLITTTDGQQDYRLKLLANLLTVAQRTDIPIGRGAGARTGASKQEPWVRDYAIAQYRGPVKEDGVGALIEIVQKSPEPITIIAIGPLQTVAAALERDPTIAAKTHFVGMHGAVFKGYQGSPTPAPEHNVRSDVPASQRVFTAPWRSLTITPLDTCGLPDMTLDGDRYQAVRRSDDPLVQAILENYASWSQAKDFNSLTRTSTLYDCVAVYLADPGRRDLINLQRLNITVTDEGLTAPSDKGSPVNVATSWRNLEGFRNHLLRVLLSSTTRPGGNPANAPAPASPPPQPR